MFNHFISVSRQNISIHRIDPIYHPSKRLLFFHIYKPTNFSNSSSSICSRSADRSFHSLGTWLTLPASKSKPVFAVKPPNKTILYISFFFKHFTSISFSIISFDLCLAFFEPSTTIFFFSFIGAFSLSILFHLLKPYQLSQKLLYLL